ncbi:MAG: hypothetical protein ABJN24_01150 [Hyphomicrobiales bacterium]
MLTFNDLDHLHEATGLFPETAIRKARYKDFGGISDQDPAGSSLSPLMLNALTREYFDNNLLDKIRAEYGRLQKLSHEGLRERIESIRQQLDLIKEANRPFNQPEAELIDVGFCIRKSIWTPEEAILLLLGRVYSDDIIKHLKSMSRFEVEKSEFATDFFQVLALMQTAIEAEEISVPGRPLEYLQWFQKMKFDVPEELESGVLEIHAPELLSSKTDVGTDLIPKERETLLKLVAAMAVRGYSFDPDAKRNDATADIQNDLDQLGIPLDQKTILKWIREACSLIHKD